jgi:hypothetical protein
LPALLGFAPAMSMLLPIVVLPELLMVGVLGPGRLDFLPFHQPPLF